jgi:hypothetical protein
MLMAALYNIYTASDIDHPRIPVDGAVNATDTGEDFSCGSQSERFDPRSQV